MSVVSCRRVNGTFSLCPPRADRAHLICNNSMKNLLLRARLAWLSVIDCTSACYRLLIVLFQLSLYSIVHIAAALYSSFCRVRPRPDVRRVARILPSISATVLFYSFRCGTVAKRSIDRRENETARSMPLIGVILFSLISVPLDFLIAVGRSRRRNFSHCDQSVHY